MIPVFILFQDKDLNVWIKPSNLQPEPPYEGFAGCDETGLFDSIFDGILNGVEARAVDEETFNSFRGGKKVIDGKMICIMDSMEKK